jgi:hypothetical protein
VPRAELDTSPKGEEYGAETQQKAAGLQTPASVMGPLESPFAQPAPSNLWDQQDAAFKPPQGEEQLPNVDPENGWNYDQILSGPTQRPFEPIATGLVGARPPKVSEVLGQMAQVSNAPDVRALLNAAHQLGM